MRKLREWIVAETSHRVIGTVIALLALVAMWAAIENVGCYIGIRRGPCAEASSPVGIARVQQFLENPTATPDHVRTGREFLERSDPDSAIVAFTRAIDLDNENHEAHFERANAHVAKHNTDDALDDLSRAIGILDRPQYRIARGALRRENQKSSDAISDFLAVIREDPNYQDAYEELLLTYGELAAYDSAIEAFSEIVEESAEGPLGYWARGISHYLAHMHDDALSDLSTVIVLTDETSGPASQLPQLSDHSTYDLESILSDTHYYRGRIYMTEYQHELARVEFTKSIDFRPSLEAYFYRGMTLNSLDETALARTDWESALEILNSEDESDAEVAMLELAGTVSANEVGIAIADSYMSERNFEAAITQYQTALSSGDLEVVDKLARAYKASDRIAEGLSVLEHASEQFPHSSDVLVAHYTLFTAIDETNHEIDRSEVAAKMLPRYLSALSGGVSDPHVLFNRAVDIAMPLDECDTLVRVLDDYLADNDDFVTLALHEKARCLQHIGEYRDAIDALNSALENDPNYSSAHYQTGLAREALEDYEYALAAYEKSIELDNSPYARIRHAYVQIFLGNHDEAEMEFEKLLEDQSIRLNLPTDYADIQREYRALQEDRHLVAPRR